jgi:RNA polymerase sigma factor (sigma-70 family)
MTATKFDSMDDASLIAHYQQNEDKACIGVLYKRYSALVFGLSYKYLQHEQNAEDAVVDIFEVLLEKLATAQIGYFRSWLFIVSRNHLLRVLRKQDAKRAASFEEMEEKNAGSFMEIAEESSLNGESEQIDLNESLVKEALDALKPAQQVCIELFYIRDQSYQEIAAFTGYDIKQVKSYIQNGKRNLRIILESKGYSK